MGWLKRQAPAAEVMHQLWQRAYARRVRLLLHCINLGEVFYLTAKLKDIETADLVLRRLQGMPVEVVSVSDYDVLAAARLKSQFPISYADAFAALTSIQSKAPLVTGDPEFRKLARKGILNLEWVG